MKPRRGEKQLKAITLQTITLELYFKYSFRSTFTAMQQFVSELNLAYVKGSR